jgi:hypothetical protein
MVRRVRFIGLALTFTMALTTVSCKKSADENTDSSDSDAQFIPALAGAAAFGVGLSTAEAVGATLVASSAIYAVDCSRPIAAGEIRFFCDGPVKLGQAAINLVVGSTRNLAGVLRWSHANVVSHLAGLAKFSSITHLKSALIGTSSAQGLENAKVSPRIENASGRRNFIDELKKSVAILDRNNSTCNYVAQYEAKLVPMGFKGGYMGGTMTRFFARAPSPATAEAMALSACEWFTDTIYRPAAGFAGYSKSNNNCRKPMRMSDYKDKYSTDDIACPAVRICVSEAHCADYSAK